jgi:hypothetical protein
MMGSLTRARARARRYYNYSVLPEPLLKVLRRLRAESWRLGCFLFGHQWRRGFWATVCDRCGRSKKDRLWEQGYGKGPPGQ